MQRKNISNKKKSEILCNIEYNYKSSFKMLEC